MKKLFYIFPLLCLFLVSCGENFKNMSGLTFGMTERQAKSALQMNNQSFVENKNFLTSDNIKYLNYEWSYQRVDFVEDHLSEIKYCITSVDTISANSFSVLKNSLVKHYPNFATKEDTQSKFVLGDDTQTITLQMDYNLVLAYSAIPTEEEVSRRLSIAQKREKEINDKLERLTKAMINYVKCLDSDPYNLREHYVREVVSLTNYLDSHQEYMTEKQKEFYKKLQEVKI